MKTVLIDSVEIVLCALFSDAVSAHTGSPQLIPVCTQQISGEYCVTDMYSYVQWSMVISGQ